MILSELTFDIRHPSVRQALMDCHDMHRNVMRAFPETDANNAREESGVLYRLLDQTHGVNMLVLSKSIPQWERLINNGVKTYRTKCIDALLAAFVPGRVLGFDLLCVPSKKVGSRGTNSRRVFLRTAQERLNWLNRKGESNGFSIVWCTEEKPAASIGQRRGGLIQFRAVRFRGDLCITDAERFTNAYQTGIGPEKAYGMGMLLLGNRTR